MPVSACEHGNASVYVKTPLCTFTLTAGLPPFFKIIIYQHSICQGITAKTLAWQPQNNQLKEEHRTRKECVSARVCVCLRVCACLPAMSECSYFWVYRWCGTWSVGLVGFLPLAWHSWTVLLFVQQEEPCWSWQQDNCLSWMLDGEFVMDEIKVISAESGWEERCFNSFKMKMWWSIYLAMSKFKELDFWKHIMAELVFLYF